MVVRNPGAIDIASGLLAITPLAVSMASSIPMTRIVNPNYKASYEVVLEALLESVPLPTIWLLGVLGLILANGRLRRMRRISSTFASVLFGVLSLMLVSGAGLCPLISHGNSIPSVYGQVGMMVFSGPAPWACFVSIGMIMLSIHILIARYKELRAA